MGWFTAIMVFVVVWWLVLFCILPIGVRSPEEAGEPLVPGQAPSAPVAPRLGLKFLATTGITIVISAIIYLIALSDWFSFRD